MFRRNKKIQRLKYITGGCILCFIISFKGLYSQDESPTWKCNGYISNVQSATFAEIEEPWQTENFLHNRLNLFWYPSPQWSGSIQFRNRFIYGDLVESYPGYGSLIEQDKGFINLNENLLTGDSYLLNTTIDRLWLQFTHQNFEVTIGRQRINWGHTFVWNPNDLFNTYSFFDVDYPERPGSDAIRLQYYTGFTSSIEMAAKLNAQNQMTLAGLWRFSKWNYDIQILGGLLNEQDYMAGIGWSGYIHNASFRGELTYAHPQKHFLDTSGLLILSVSTDYTLPHSLSIRLEGLYNQLPENYRFAGFEQFYYQPLSAKQLSFTKLNLFAQISYPVTPLFQTSLSGIYYPKYEGYFIGPEFTYSLSQNLETALILQSFSGTFEQAPKTNKKTRQSVNIGYFRFKWNF